MGRKRGRKNLLLNIITLGTAGVGWVVVTSYVTEEERGEDEEQCGEGGCYRLCHKGEEGGGRAMAWSYSVP